ncbi:MAG: hypothetical protein WC600_11305 [Desulfobaccales bacterium]
MSRQDTDAKSQGSMDKNRGEEFSASEDARRFFLAVNAKERGHEKDHSR